MRLVPGQRRIEISAGAFALFGGSRVAGRCGRWRAEVGREWHAALQAEENPAEGWRFEVAVKTFWVEDGWTLAVDGRIDQLRENAEEILVREVKTVSGPLPRPEEFWREERRHFFVQLALYCLGLRQRPENAGKKVRGELLLVEPATGMRQLLSPTEPAEEWIGPSARLLAQWGESRGRSRMRLEHLRFQMPFAEMRPEWLAAREELARRDEPVVLLEAPTGFGKTALALEDALRRLRDGEVARIVYATGKNSGRIQVRRELERMVDPGALRVLTLHAKEEHRVADTPEAEEIWRANWRRAGIDPERLFAEGKTDLAAVRALGAAAGVPPWEITRALLPLTEFLLCDYNYIFSPRQAGVLENLPGWDDREALLIVDEAHNLPARAAEARSWRAEENAAARAGKALERAGAPREWRRQWAAWTEYLEGLVRADRLTLEQEYWTRDLCEEIGRLWTEQPLFGLEPEDEDVWETLALPEEILATLDDAAAERYLLRVPEPGVLAGECLEAAEEIGARIRGFGRAVLMSATLAPAEEFLESCGLAEEAAAGFLECAAEWRRHAYTVAVDTRVDTRLKSRERHLRTTAETVLALGEEPPVVVFFPSYRYAEAVRTYVAALDPGFQVVVQPAGTTPAEQEAFVAEALVAAHGIFLVLGGGLAEGIDLLGGKVERAMVVSPGLPEVNAVQAARRTLLEKSGGREDGFRRVFLVPALRKVNQALGRLVRGPGQKAKVLLHCRRFAEAACAELLAEEYRGGEEIRREEDLARWLRE